MSATRLYYLHPLLAGPVDAWANQLDRAAAMRFDTVAIAPPFATGRARDLFLTADHERVAEKVADLAERLEALPDRLLVYTDNGEATLEAALHRGLSPDGSLVRRASLEDVFLRLTGRTLVD